MRLPSGNLVAIESPFLMTSPSESNPHFTQSEREAIVDLLHLCIYADAHIGGKESEAVARVVESVGWDTQMSFSGYEPRSIASARAARGDEAMLRDFLQRARERLASRDSRAFALAKCMELAASDGTDQREASLLTRIKAALQ